jgi:hypothetical protein
LLRDLAEGCQIAAAQRGRASCRDDSLDELATAY